MERSAGWFANLVDTKHPLGILSMGTFNNFAKSLHLPTTVDAAIRVIKTGKPHPITLGRLNGKIFLEAAAIGLFGETIAAGESAKDKAFGAFAEDVETHCGGEAVHLRAGRRHQGQRILHVARLHEHDVDRFSDASERQDA